MVLYVKNNNTTWKNATTIFVKAGVTGWSSVKKLYVKTKDNIWKLVYGSAGPDINTNLQITANSYTYTGSNNIKLTGTNYHWTYSGSLTLSYEFYKSGDGSSYLPIYYTGSTSTPSWPSYTPGNPSSGSSNSISYPTGSSYLSMSNFSASPEYFVFSIQATDSNGTTNASSTPIQIYVSDPTITDGNWSGNSIAGNQLIYQPGTPSATATSIKTYITRSDGLVILNDSGPQNGYTITDGTNAITTNVSSGLASFYITTKQSDNSYYYNAYTKAYSVTGTNPGTSNTVGSGIITGLYSFSFGNVLYPNTNGWIHLDSGGGGVGIPLSTRSIAVYPLDLVESSIYYWSDSSTFFTIQYDGYQYGYYGNSNYRLTYQARFNQYYVDILIINKGSSLSIPSQNPGMYSYGTVLVSIPGPYFISAGSKYRIYFDGSSAIMNPAITAINQSIMVSAGAPTSGTADTGYTSITTATNQYTKSTISGVTLIPGPNNISITYTSSTNDFQGYNWDVRTSSYSGTIVKSGTLQVGTLNVTGLSNTPTKYYVNIYPYNSQNQAGTTYQDTTTTTGIHSFNVGDTLYVGTNGYVAFDSANYSVYPSNGLVLGIVSEDLIQSGDKSGRSGYNYNINYYCDGTTTAYNWYGYRYDAQTTPDYLNYWVKIDSTNNTYADVYFSTIGANVVSNMTGASTTYGMGMYFNGALLNQRLTTVTQGYVYRVYFDGSSIGLVSTSGSSFINSSDYLSNLAPTIINPSNGLYYDDGYTTWVTSSNQYKNPTITVSSATAGAGSLSFTITITGPTVSYDWDLRSTSYAGSVVKSGTGATASTLSITGLGKAATTYYLNVYPRNTEGAAGTTVQKTGTTLQGYSITYNGNGNTGGSAPTDSEIYSSSNTITAAGAGTLTRTNYVLLSWNTKSDGSGTDYALSTGTFSISADTTLYAKWGYLGLVTFNANGATGSPSPTSARETSYNGGVALATVGTMTNGTKTFSGWATTSSDTSAVSDPYKPGSTDATLYAIWTTGLGNFTYNVADTTPSPSDAGTPTLSQPTTTSASTNAISLNYVYDEIASSFPTNANGIQLTSWGPGKNSNNETIAKGSPEVIIRNLNLFSVGSSSNLDWYFSGYNATGSVYASSRSVSDGTNQKATISWTASSNAGSYTGSYTISGDTTSTKNKSYTISAQTGTSYDVTTDGTVTVNSITAWINTDGTGTSKAGTAGTTTAITTAAKYGSWKNSSAYAFTYFTTPSAPATTPWASTVANGSNFQRSGTTYIRWGWKNVTVSGSGTANGFAYEVRSANDTLSTDITNSGTKAYTTTNDSRQVYTTSYPYVISSPTEVTYSASSRYGRVRAIISGADGITYYGTWTGNI